nr:hypothetical protein [Tanacetum cinerariifolium]
MTLPNHHFLSVPLDHVDVLGQDVQCGFTLTLLDHFLSKGICTVKSIPPKCRLGFSQVLKRALDNVICTPDDISCWVSLLVLPICLLKTFRPRSNLECKSVSKRQHQEECIASGIRSWGTPGVSLQLLRETLAEPTPLLSDIDISEGDLDLSEQNIKQCKRKICDGHYTATVRVLSSSGVAPYKEATLDDLKTKHPFKSAPFLPHTPIDHHQLMASPGLVLDMIKSFLHGTSCGPDGLRAQHLMDYFSGAAVAILDELFASITQVVNLFLDRKCPKRLGEYIASASLKPLVKPEGGIRPIAVGTVWRRLVSKFCATMIGHSLDTYLNDLQFGIGVSGGGEAILHAVNRLIEDRSDDIGLSMLLVDFQNAFNLVDRKTEVFWPREDPRSRIAGVSPHTIARPLHGVKLLGGLVSVDFGFNSELVLKRVAKSIELMDAVAKLNDPQCELLLLRACAERIVTAFGPGFGDWQWRLATLPFAFGGLGVYCAGDVLSYAFLGSRLQSASLQTKLLRQSGLGQTINGRTYRCVLCYRLGVPLFSVSKPCSACSRVFIRDIYGDHAVSCAGIVGIKHRHNVVRDTLVDICYRSGISSGKEVDIGLCGERDKSLRPVDVLLYSWDVGRDVCVDLTGSSPLTHTGMVDFVPGRAVTETAQRKHVKYEAKCANIGYGFLPYSFSSFGELEKDAMTLLKRTQKFSMSQDIGARTPVHIFNRISFFIAKGVEAHIVSRFPSNLL